MTSKSNFLCASELGMYRVVNLSKCNTAQKVSLLAFSERVLEEHRVSPSGETIFLPRSYSIPYPPKKNIYLLLTTLLFERKLS